MREITSQAELDQAGSEWVVVKKGSFIARESSHVVARGSSHVEAWESSHVVARESSHVVAWESSHVEAWESSHVEAWGSSHVVARDFASIVKLSVDTTIIQGIKATIITPIYPETMEEWCELKGLKITRGRVHLFKCVRPDGKDFYSGTINYLQKNKDIIDPLFDRTHKEECGKGLHLADSPAGAEYFISLGQEYKLLEVTARVADCIPFPGLPSYPMKVRARACRFIKVLEEGTK